MCCNSLYGLREVSAAREQNIAPRDFQWLAFRRGEGGASQPKKCLCVAPVFGKRWDVVDNDAELMVFIEGVND